MTARTTTAKTDPPDPTPADTRDLEPTQGSSATTQNRFQIRREAQAPETYNKKRHIKKYCKKKKGKREKKRIQGSSYAKPGHAGGNQSVPAPAGNQSNPRAWQGGNKERRKTRARATAVNNKKHGGVLITHNKKMALNNKIKTKKFVRRKKNKIKIKIGVLLGGSRGHGRGGSRGGSNRDGGGRAGGNTDGGEHFLATA